MTNYVGMSSICTMPCLEKSRDSFDAHRKKAGSHQVMSTREFENDCIGFNTVFNMGIWRELRRSLNGYFEQIKADVRRIEKDALQQIDSLQMQTALRTKDRRIVGIGHAIRDNKLRSLPCRDISDFFEKLEATPATLESINSSVLSYQTQILEQVRTAIKAAGHKTQIKQETEPIADRRVRYDDEREPVRRNQNRKGSDHHQEDEPRRRNRNAQQHLPHAHNQRDNYAQNSREQISTIEEVLRQRGGRSTVCIRILRIIKQLSIMNSDKTEFEGADESGTAIFVAKTSALIREGNDLQMTQCYTFVFRDTWQIQTSDDSKVRVSTRKVRPNEDAFLSKKQGNSHYRRRPKKQYQNDNRPAMRQDREYNRQPRRDQRENNRQPRRDQRESNRQPRRDQRENHREPKREERENMREPRRQEQERAKEPSHNQDSSSIRRPLIKISDIGPGEEGINCLAEVFSINDIGPRQIKCTLGDETSLIDAIIPVRHEFVKEGQTIGLENCEADVIEGHIKLIMHKGSGIKTINQKIKRINCGHNVSQKTWEEVNDD